MPCFRKVIKVHKYAYTLLFPTVHEEPDDCICSDTIGKTLADCKYWSTVTINQNVHLWQTLQMNYEIMINLLGTTTFLGRASYITKEVALWTTRNSSIFLKSPNYGALALLATV